jgi:hypothetical protein
VLCVQAYCRAKVGDTFKKHTRLGATTFVIFFTVLDKNLTAVVLPFYTEVFIDKDNTILKNLHCL